MFVHRLATVLCVMRAGALKGKNESLRCLIALGADISAGDFQGETALHLAARKGHVNAVG